MLDLALELAPGICAYGKYDPLARLHSTDVGFIDGDGDLHPAQVVCDRKYRRRLQGCSYRRAKLDTALNDHAIYRRANIGIGQVYLDLAENGLHLIDPGGVNFQLCFRYKCCGTSCIIAGIGYRTRRLESHLTGKGHFRFGHPCFLHDLSSASLIEIRFSSIAPEPDLIGIEPGEDLAGS